MSFEVCEMLEALRTGNAQTRSDYIDRILRISIPLQIRGMRKAKGWTQAQLARKLGVSQGRISDLETTGAPLPSIRTLQRVASVFDVALLCHFTSWPEFIEYALSVESIAGPATPTSFEND